MYPNKPLAVFSTIKDELVSKRYLLVKPADAVYPLGDSPTYPDFCPWSHTSLEDAVAVANLHKGYSESTVVQNEYLLARSAMTPALSPDALTKLQVAVVQAIQSHENCNRIASAAHTFKLPPRVTLTDQKREVWLTNLADPQYPLRQLSRTIPHGLRKTKMLQQCVAKRIPSYRAVWFVKCISGNEIRNLAKKAPSLANAWWILEAEWLAEWTLTILRHVETLCEELSDMGGRAVDVKGGNPINGEGLKPRIQEDFAYTLRLVSSLFHESMLDRPLFLTGILELTKAEMMPPPLEYTLVGLTFIKHLWEKYLHPTPTVGLSLTLVRMYIQLQTFYNNLKVTPHHNKHLTKAPLIVNLLSSVKDLLRALFRMGSADIFILPDVWPAFQTAIGKDNWLVEYDTQEYWEVINYRNECLCGNTTSEVPDPRDVITQGIVTKLDRLAAANAIPLDALDDLYDVVMAGVEENSEWVGNVETVVYWSVTRLRQGLGPLIGARVLATFFNRLSIGEMVNGLRLDFERAILDTIYSIPDHHQGPPSDNPPLDLGSDQPSLHPQSVPASVDPQSFHLFIRELYHCKIFNVGSYVRKLISSGLFYNETPTATIEFHIAVFTNLPLVQNPASLNQANMILRKLNHPPERDNYPELEEIALTLSQAVTADGPLPSFPGLWERCRGLTLALQTHFCHYLVEALIQCVTSAEWLVHVTPAKITLLYRVFKLNHGLASFFDNVLVKLVLQNEAKVVVHHLESLHLMASLIQRHQRDLLWGSVSSPLNHPFANRRYSRLRRAQEIGSDLTVITPTEPSKPYYSPLVLTQLVMESYIDLTASQDDPFYLRFAPFWQVSLRMIDTCASLWTLDEAVSVAFTAQLEKVMITESELRYEFNLHELSTLAHDLIPETDSFSQADAGNILVASQGNFNALMDAYVFHLQTQSPHATPFSPQVSPGSLPLEDNFLKILHHYRTNFPVEFDLCIRSYLATNHAKLLHHSGGCVYRLFARMLIHQVMQVSELVQAVHDVDPLVRKSLMTAEPDFATGSRAHFYNVLYELLFTDEAILHSSEAFQAMFSKDHQLRLEIIVEAYPQEYPEAYVQLLAHGLSEVNALESVLQEGAEAAGGLIPPLSKLALCLFVTFSGAYGGCIQRTVATLAVTQMPLLVEVLMTDSLLSEHHKLFLAILNGVINPSEKDAERVIHADDCVSIPRFLSCFNLPFYQLLLRLVLGAETTPREGAQVVTKAILEADALPSATLLGEAIRYLTESFQAALMQECESMLLKNQRLHLQLDRAPGDELAQNTRVTHALADIISKLSRLVNTAVSFSPDLLTGLRSLLAKLLEWEGEGGLHEAPYVASIFCKILLINHQQIVEVLFAQADELFLQDLERLLQLRLFAQSSKLRILLYDILLLMRTAVNVLTNGADGPAAQSLPALSETVTPLRDESVPSQAPSCRLVLRDYKTGECAPFRFKNLEFLEDANPVGTMNDAPLNMALFDTVIERRNPT